jgi:hypothetical protein
MLTATDATQQRSKLRAARDLVLFVRDAYTVAGRVPGLRKLNEIAELLREEITDLTKIIEAEQPE